MAVDNQYNWIAGLIPILRNLVVKNKNAAMQCSHVRNVIVSFVSKIPAHPNTKAEIRKKKWKPTLKAVTKISLLFFICDILQLRSDVLKFDPPLLVVAITA